MASKKTAQETNVERMLELIKQNPRITRKEMVAQLNKADGIINQHLDSLKKSDVIKRIGSTRSGCWQLKD